MFRALKHIEFLNWTPTELDQWCDNEQVVKDSMEYPYHPTDITGTVMDLVLAIHQIKSTLSFAVTC